MSLHLLFIIIHQAQYMVMALRNKNTLLTLDMLLCV